MDSKKPELDTLFEEIPELVRQGGAKAQPFEEQFSAIKQQIDECSLGLDDLNKKIDDQLDKANELNLACDELKKWLPEALNSPAIKDPVSSEPNDILKQVAEMKVNFVLYLSNFFKGKPEITLT